MTTPSAPQITPAVQVKQWSTDEDSPETYTDFMTGDGLTKVLIGTNGSDKSGLELIIGGTLINDQLEDPITLGCVRQLRDNLTALLNHEGIAAALGDTSLPSTAPAPDSPLLDDLRGWVDSHLAGGGGTHAPDGTPLAVPGISGGIFVTEGATSNLNGGITPTIAPRADGVLCIGYGSDASDPPQPIVEVLRLKAFELVIVATEHEVHVLSESEWSRHV